MILPSAKRRIDELSNIANWHRYYAGYAENFVIEAAKQLNLDSNCVVIDPWSGSGTTGYALSLQRISTKSIDLNPVMAIFGAAKLFSPREINDFGDYLEEAENFGEEIIASVFLTYYLGSEVAKYIAKYVSFTNLDLKECRDFTCRPIDREKSFYLAALFKTMREMAGISATKNPSWTNISVKNIELKDFKDALLNNLITMSKDIQNSFAQDTAFNAQYIGNIINFSTYIDAPTYIITSPPYLTRIDYAVSTELEIHSILPQKFDSLRRSITGSPTIRKIHHDEIETRQFGNYTHNLLNSVKTHPSKASETYYWKNIIQYFDDMHKSIKNLTSNPNLEGGLIVVQNSYYKEIPLDITRVIRDYFDQFNFDSCIVAKDSLTNVLTNVNSRSKAYLKNKTYSEDVIQIMRR